jgi:hypothetical protein
MSYPSSVKFGLGLAVLLALSAALGDAAVCQVPSAPYPTIQSAVDDPSCTEIVLATQTFDESVTVGRDLTLRGASSTTSVIEGQLTVAGGSTQLELADLTIDASAAGVAGTCTEALQVTGGAEVNGRDIVVLNAGFDPSAVFADGFESGDTSAWSTAVP